MNYRPFTKEQRDLLLLMEQTDWVSTETILMIADMFRESCEDDDEEL